MNDKSWDMFLLGFCLVVFIGMLVFLWFDNASYLPQKERVFSMLFNKIIAIVFGLSVLVICFALLKKEWI